MISSNILYVKALGFPWTTQDPFLFCAYHLDNYPKGNIDMEPKASLEGRKIGQDFANIDGWNMYHGSKIPGFPYHPHRGFETISIAKQGVIDHSDSLGAAGRFGPGDVQWMTAGKGIQHSEMFPLLDMEHENPLELFQVWLNLPKDSKFVEPHFKMLWREDISTLSLRDDNGKLVKVDVIAGSLNGVKAPAPTPDSWAADPANEVAIWTIRMQANASFVVPSAIGNVNRDFYFYKGDTLTIDGQEVAQQQSISVNPNEDLEIVAGSENCYLLMLQGKPINEPIANYGPFVMNTQEEIQEALLEYQQTQFGGWPWAEQEMVHGRKIGRFALYSNGTKEER